MTKFLTNIALFFMISTMVSAGNLTTTGLGQVSVVPDMARVSVNLQAEHANASTALQIADSGATQLIEALMALGIEPADVGTTGLNLYPSQEWRDGQVVREFFVASHRLNINVRDLAAIGVVLDEVTGIRIESSFSLTLDVADKETALQTALARAMTDARAKAEILAGAERMSIMTVSDIDSQLFSPVTSTDSREADIAVGIAPGEFTVSAQVRVTYEIGGE